MEREFVWAIDDSGDLTRCYAKPENRGKGTCHHVLHSQEGESLESFAKKVGCIAVPTPQVDSEKYVPSEKDYEDLEDALDSYDDMVDEMVDHAEIDYARAFEVNLNRFFSGHDWNVDGVDEDSLPNDVIVHFTIDGVEYSVPIPKQVNGKFNINGTEYRLIPAFMTKKNKFAGQNDVEDREVLTYEDRIGYTVGKHLRSALSGLKRVKGSTLTQDTFRNLSSAIRKDLVMGSYMRIADDLNPIASLSQAEKVTWIGEGAAYNTKSFPDSIREMDSSYFDPCDTTLGGNIGKTVGGAHIYRAEYPYVDDDGKERVYITHKAEKAKIIASDFIPFKNYDDPQRATMAVSQMREATPIVGGEDPLVSTPAWDKIKGSKIGVNLTTAYIPCEGTWEDAVVISESAAAKMKCKYKGRFFDCGVGDKLSGRHGNKGVISKILPDDQMPIIDGKPADIIMSPIGIAGRANLGQVKEIEANGGGVKVATFQGKKINCTAGKQYVMRINQIAELKILSNSNKKNADGTYWARFGEMEHILLSTSPERLDILNYLKHQESSATEEKMTSLLHAAGIDIVDVEEEVE